MNKRSLKDCRQKHSIIKSGQEIMVPCQKYLLSAKIYETMIMNKEHLSKTYIEILVTSDILIQGLKPQPFHLLFLVFEFTPIMRLECLIWSLHIKPFNLSSTLGGFTAERFSHFHSLIQFSSRSVFQIQVISCKLRLSVAVAWCQAFIKFVTTISQNWN